VKVARERCVSVEDVVRSALLRRFLLALVWLAVGGCAQTRNDAPRAVHGELDLRHWDFEQRGTLKLNGDWEFYWQKELAPGDIARGIAPSGYVDTGSWAFKQVGDKVLPRHGYGTYRLRVHLPAQSRLVTLKIDEIYSASTVYIDGRLAFRNGVVGHTAETNEIMHRPRLLDHEVAPGGELEIVVAAANFEYTYPGIMGVSIGMPAELHRAREISLTQSVLVLGSIIFMMLYHLALYALRPGHTSPLDLALLCAGTALFNLVTSGELAFYLVPGLDGELWWKLYFWGWFGGVLGYQLFLQGVLPDEFPAKLRRPLIAFVCVGALLVLALPFRIFHVPLARVFQVYSVVGLVHCMTVLARGVTQKREGSRILLAGTAVLFGVFVHDLMVSEHIIQGMYLISVGLLFVLFAQSIMLAARFSKAFSMVEASERARTQFFHNTSHELRTPLNGILGFVDLLRRGTYGNLAPGARAALDKVAHLAESLRGQVNTILDLAKSKQGRLVLTCARISLNDVVHELRALADGLSLHSPELYFDCELSWDLEREAPSFVSDHDKLLTILRNLIGNAFKFREQGRPHHVYLRVRLTGGMLECEVEDTGIGIAEDQQSRIFEEFVQVEAHASRAYEGTGLGLAMVKSCVKLLGGELQLDSVPGKGTRIKVRLPEREVNLAVTPVRAAGPLPSIQPQPASSGLVQSGVITLSSELSTSEVLVVDDNPTNLEVMRELLRSAGIPVVTCSGGREALERMREQPPDLLLLDLMMPEVSGEDVLREVRRDARLSDVPVILLTARASHEDRLLGLRLGADDYLAKPVDSGELLLRVRNGLARAHLSREKMLRDQNLEAARAVQQALLPTHRKFPGVSLADHYRAAEQTGGDWFGYAFDDKSKRFFVAIGDVTGHGMPAALVTGAAAGAFKASTALLRGQVGTGEQLLVALAEAVHEAVRDTGRNTGRMMTMTFVCIDAGSGQGWYLNAGHQPLFVFGREGSRALVSQGTALGSPETPRFAVQGFQLRRGESCFLYTDGLTENSGPDGKTLSLRRLQKLLGSASSPSDLKLQLLGTLDALWKDRAPPDDCSFVIVRWEPDALPSRVSA
jgi:signal transduction histidine kinase/serine phosphatase RsbU (regulator of sigma subunit)